jgi:hypothetical protein
LTIAIAAICAKRSSISRSSGMKQPRSQRLALVGEGRGRRSMRRARPVAHLLEVLVGVWRSLADHCEHFLPAVVEGAAAAKHGPSGGAFAELEGQFEGAWPESDGILDRQKPGRRVFQVQGARDARWDGRDRPNQN